MKSKKSRLIGIIVGSVLVVLTVFLVLKPEDKAELKPQTKKSKIEVIRLEKEQDTSEQEFVYELDVEPSFPR